MPAVSYLDPLLWEEKYAATLNPICYIQPSTTPTHTKWSSLPGRNKRYLPFSVVTYQFFVGLSIAAGSGYRSCVLHHALKLLVENSRYGLMTLGSVGQDCGR